MVDTRLSGEGRKTEKKDKKEHTPQTNCLLLSFAYFRKMEHLMPW